MVEDAEDPGGRVCLIPEEIYYKWLIKETTVEVCCLLERLRNAKDYIPLKLDMEDYYKIKDGKKL